MTIALTWKPTRDGYGFYYGTLRFLDRVHSVDLLPPTSVAAMPTILRTIRADAEMWVAYIDGREVGRALTRCAAEAALLAAVAGAA